MNSNFKVHPTFTKYLIGKNGDVINKNTGKKLKLTTNGYGYLKVTLMKDKKAHTRLVNRLVLETYDPIENAHLYHAHHENRIRDDNRLKNLEWELIPEHMREHARNVSEETRRKLSEANKGKVLSEETRRKLSEAHKGKLVSEETRRKRSEANKGNQWNVGKVRSEETKKKMGESKKGMLFWNDGTRNIRSKECPGEGWMRGRK